MKHFIDMLKLIKRHPLLKGQQLQAFQRFLKWETISRISDCGIVYPFVENSRLILKRHMDGATGNIIAGLQDYEEMFFVLHFLRPNDLFMDIGANVGTYTVLASRVRKAKSIAVEPTPNTFLSLKDNIRLNDIEGIATCLNIALGSADSTLDFVVDQDCMNHVATEKDKTGKTITVQIKKLDEVLKGEVPGLIKIDVEGYEANVIEGGNITIAHPGVKAIIAELNGSGSRYGLDDQAVHNKLLGLGFAEYAYQPRGRELIPGRINTYGNTIYIRDIEYVKQRLADAPSISILNQLI